jgi:hypothetical protein
MSMKQRARVQSDAFNMPIAPGNLLGFYFSCGPVASLGFLIGDLPGLLFAVACDMLFWFLLTLLEKDKKRAKSLSEKQHFRS